MTSPTDSPLFPCPQCAAPTVFRYGMGHYYPRKCDTCALDARRARDRKVAEKRRRARGVAPVKGTAIACRDCGDTFVHNAMKAIRCAPCQRKSILERANAASQAKARAKGYRKEGEPVICAHCSEVFPLTKGRQKFCPKCRELPDRVIYPQVIERQREAARRHAARNPERIKEYQRESRRRRKQNPAFTVNERMSAGVRYSLAAGKQGSSWETLVGYTKDDLVAHLEKQFLPGMSWDRREEFHIDHIVPLASFSFETADDPEFLAAWALTNLRPLWALDNITKNDRRTHLL